MCVGGMRKHLHGCMYGIVTVAEESILVLSWGGPGWLLSVLGGGWVRWLS